MDAKDSPEIEYLRYDEQTQILSVQYRGDARGPGWLHRYSKVPKHLYEGLQQAASTADYLVTRIEAAGYRPAGSISFKRLLPASAITEARKRQVELAIQLAKQQEEREDEGSEAGATVETCGLVLPGEEE